MKNFVKLLGVIALVAVIGFGFTACGDNNGGGGTPQSTTLTLNTWTNGNIATAGVDGGQLFRFTATAERHWIHFILADTLPDVVVMFYEDSSLESSVGSNLGGSPGSKWLPTTVGQTYYFRVLSAGETGTFQIMFSDNFMPSGVEPTQLTLDTWESREFSRNSSEQWFSFTATANTLFLHSSEGLSPFIQVFFSYYDSAGNVNGDFLFNPINPRNQMSVVSGETYYIRLTARVISAPATLSILLSETNTPPTPPGGGS